MKNRQDAVLMGSAPIAVQWLYWVPENPPPRLGTTAKPSTVVGREASRSSAQQQHRTTVAETRRPAAALGDLAPELGSIVGPRVGLTLSPRAPAVFAGDVSVSGVYADAKYPGGECSTARHADTERERRGVVKAKAGCFLRFLSLLCSVRPTITHSHLRRTHPLFPSEQQLQQWYFQLTLELPFR